MPICSTIRRHAIALAPGPTEETQYVSLAHKAAPVTRRQPAWATFPLASFEQLCRSFADVAPAAEKERPMQLPISGVSRTRLVPIAGAAILTLIAVAVPAVFGLPLTVRRHRQMPQSDGLTVRPEFWIVAKELVCRRR
jgi:hypothetical protein